MTLGKVTRNKNRADFAVGEYNEGMLRFSFSYRLPLFACLCSAAIAYPAGFAAAGESSAQMVSGETVETLIAALGAKSFAMREAAMRQLFDGGLEAVPQLRAAADSSDREVRRRARRITAEIARRDRPRRMQLLLSGLPIHQLLDDTSHFGIPGLETYFNLVPDTVAARRLLGRALRDEWDLLDRMCDDATADFELLEERCAAIRQDRANKSVPPSSMAALLLAAIHPTRGVPDRTAIQIYSMLSQMDEQGCAEIMEGDTIWEHPTFRQLVGAFILRSDGPTAIYQGLNTALRHGLPEGLEAAERVAQGGFALPHIRQFAILTIARFGNRRHIRDLEHLAADDQVYYTRRAHHRDLRFECQVGDLAMASMLYLSGADPVHFGFRHLKTSDCYVFQPHTVGFESDIDRQAARHRFRLYFMQSPLP